MEKYKEQKAIEIHEELEALESYITQLKKKYRRHAKCISESQWPNILAKFTKLGYVIHKPKRTRKQTDLFARLATSGYESLPSESTHTCACGSFGEGVDQNYDHCCDVEITIKEEISDIFLPHNNNGCSQIILIEGAPGIGKTRLMTQIGLCWADGKILNDKKVVLFFPLRELNANIISVEDMFTYACEDKVIALKCLKYFQNNNGKDLMILLDGLDENSQAMNFSYKTLIKDNTFDKACIAIASRPHATVPLQQYASYRVEIVGFTNERRREFVKENLKENAQDLEKILKKHPKIDTLCYIPLNMSIMLFLFQNEPSRDNIPLADTQTELIHQAVMMTIRRRLETLKVTVPIENLKELPEPYNNIFMCLCVLAYDTLSKDILIFTENKIKAFCSVKGNEQVEKAVTNGLDLLQKATFFADLSRDTDSLSNFAHSSIQEFLAAWYFTFSYHCCFYPLPLKCKCLRFLSQLKVLHANFWEGNNINMWSFYIGLTKGEDSVFKHFLSGTYLCCSCCCKQGKNYSISEKIVNNKIKSLLLYSFLQEAPDNEMIQLLNVVFTQNSLDVSGQTVNLENKKDLELLGHILSKLHSTRLWDKVILSSCKIDDESFEVLHNILVRNDRSPKIKALQLCDNNLISCGNAIVNLVCHKEIKHLDVSKNALKLLNLEDHYIKKCATFLETLNISDNKLNGEKAMKLFEALKYLEKLRVLNLSNNDIEADKEKIDALGLALCCCNSLEELEIYGNLIEDEALSIFKVINNIRSSTSYVCYYRLSSKVSKFLKILEYCNKKDYYQPDKCILRNKIIQFKVVDVSCNHLKNDDGCTLGQNLHLLANLTVLNITENDISDEASKSLTTGLLFAPNLEQFRYDKKSFNEVNNIVFEMIRRLRITNINNTFECTPSKIGALIFILNCINDSEEKVQSLTSDRNVVSTIGLITELNLSHNEPTTDSKRTSEDIRKLTSEDIRKLCIVLRWFKQLKVLDISNNDITIEAKEPMTKAMLQIHTLNSIKLIGNPISDDELSVAVFNNIRSLYEKKLQSIIFDQSNCSHVESIIYIMECLKEYKDLNDFKLFNDVTTVETDAESGYGANFFEYLNFLPFLKHLKINHVESITDYGMKQLSKYLTHNKTLTTLDLSHCDLEDLEVENGPSNIVLKVLKLNHCHITDGLLFQLFQNVPKVINLDELEIEGNCFWDRGISHLHNVLLNDQNGPTIATLNLADNQLTDNSAAQIMEIVQMCTVKCLDISVNFLENIFPHFKCYTVTTLECLNISCNNLKDKAVGLGQQLHLLVSLKILDISKNYIPDTAVTSLTTGLLLTSNLKEFKYDENLFSEDSIIVFEMLHQLRTISGIKLFKCAPSKVKAFVFILNCINDNEEKVQSSDIVSTIGLITELNLSHSEPTTSYKLTDEDIKELCVVLTWFKQLEVLDIRNNGITSEAKQPLAKVMLQIYTLSDIKLIGNLIFYDKLSIAIFDTIMNLREKQIQSIIYDEKSPSNIECQSIVYVIECNQLDNVICFKSFDSITTVEIGSKSITDLKFDYGVKILENLNFLPFLNKLKINHVTCVTDCAISKLNIYLSQNRTLTILDLSSCNLGKFKLGPNNSIPLKILKLNYCHITENILHNLCLNILKYTNLDQLEIKGNHFGDKGITHLHNILVSSEDNQPTVTITVLNLANNQLTEESATKIVEIVQKCKVKHLDISDNHLQSILICLGNCTNTTIENLNISANSHQTDNAVEFVGDFSYLTSCRSLKKLNISNNSIDDKAIDELYDFYIKCIHLKEVMCDGNPAVNEIKLAFYVVQNLYNEQGCVKSIDFKGKRTEALTLMLHISLSYESHARVLITYVSQVTLIDFSCNGMQIDKNIICLLEICTQLEELDLQNNNITNETIKHLATGYLFASKLMISNLHLSGNPCMDVPRDRAKNVLVLQIIETLRCKTKDYYECHPTKFESFLTVLELIDSVNDHKKQNDVLLAISFITRLNMNLEQISGSSSLHLKITNQKLQSCDIKKFCKYLKYFKSLKSIQMIGNNIEEDVKDDLAIAVLKKYSIIEIQLGENPIHKTRCSRLFSTIINIRTSRKRRTSVKTDTSGNTYAYPFKYHPEALEALVSMLQYIKQFANKTCDITENTEELDIGEYKQEDNNERIDNPVEVTTGLIYHLKLFRRLKLLNLKKAYVTLYALPELSKFLYNNDTLLQLDISHNDITADGALIVLRSLHSNTTLKKLNLEHNKISGPKCEEITTIICSLPKNIKVDIQQGNQLTKESKKILKLK